MKNLSKRKQKEYEKVMNEQFKILIGHFSRCMLRVHNKHDELHSEMITDLEQRAKH